jgi:hypothetical protein
MIVSSAGTGMHMKKTGHYKWFPTIGFAITVIPYCLLGWALKRDTNINIIECYLFLFGASRRAVRACVGARRAQRVRLTHARLRGPGLGLGFSNQVLMIVAQNSVSQGDIAVSTATLSFLRSLGGSVCITIAQVIFNNTLSVGQSGGSSLFSLDTARRLPPRIFIPFMDAFTVGLCRGYQYLLALVLVGLVVAPWLSGAPLRTKVGDGGVTVQMRGHGHKQQQPGHGHVDTGALHHGPEKQDAHNTPTGAGAGTTTTLLSPAPPPAAAVADAHRSTVVTL